MQTESYSSSNMGSGTKKGKVVPPDTLEEETDRETLVGLHYTDVIKIFTQNNFLKAIL